MDNPRRIALLPGLALALLMVVSSPAHAQEVDFVASVAGGTGVSMGGGSAGVIAKLSPMTLDIDVGLVFDKDWSMEWTPSIILELGGRISVGVNPSLKRFVKLSESGWASKMSIYGGIGVPFIFAPFTLLGAEAAVGVTYEFFPNFSPVLELHSDVFFAGSDLPEGSVLVKVDFTLGIRYRF